MMGRTMFWSRTRIALGALLVLASGLSASAEPTVTAVLTESETALGRPVQLEIQVSGASNPKPPGEIAVDGLDIRAAGTSRNYQMQNFSVSYSFTYSYTIMPMRAGTFNIPPQVVDVGGKALRTPELTLTVVNSPAGQSARPGRRGQNESGTVDPAQIGFVEMILPKNTAYVGEMIPVQIRLGLNTRAPVESLGSGVQIAGQGFTTQKMPEPRQTMETINGRSYQVFIFKTAISPARTGKIEVGPAEINPVVRVARAGQRNPSLPRDLFDDPFFNNFFNDPAFAPSTPREIKLKSENTTLEVKPLPPNAPPQFAGAVGTFVLKADANPRKTKAGDPLTVAATVTGRGNFDRVTAPVLEDERGWHKYPPSDRFKQDDDVGISGAKTFETVLTARERKSKLPPVVFSFFDPVKETYVTLKSEEIPLQIEGGAAPTPTPSQAVTAPAATSAPSVPPIPTPAKQEQDILYQLTDQPAANQSFTPVYARRSFWAAQLLPLLLLCGLIGWKVHRVRLSNLVAQRVARLQKEASELGRKLRGNGTTPQQYVADASRAVQLKTALARNVDPNMVDADAAAAAFRLDEEGSARLRRLFQESDEMRYSGGRNGGSPLSPEKRQEILELVENLRA
ncbi:MAG: BatD family protein [Verrucomicrobiota bacterium]|nr:BatD family protein [Verrucomicrobiota bacterium]